MANGQESQSPNQLDKERIATYCAGLGPDSRWPSPCATIVGNQDKSSGKSWMRFRIGAGQRFDRKPQAGKKSVWGQWIPNRAVALGAPVVRWSSPRNLDPKGKRTIEWQGDIATMADDLGADLDQLLA